MSMEIVFPIPFLIMEGKEREVASGMSTMWKTIIATLAHTGFFVEDMVETLPDEHALQECPGMIKEFIKPSFLIVRARKMTREM